MSIGKVTFAPEQIAEIRDRFNKEWNALGIVAGLFAVTAAVFFVTPPAAVLSNETDDIVSLYGFAAGSSMLAGLATVICVSVYQMLLNRTRNSKVHDFVTLFKFFLQMPLYFLVASATALALVCLITVHAMYNKVFLAAIAMVPLTFVFGLSQLWYMTHKIQPNLETAVLPDSDSDGVPSPSSTAVVAPAPV